MKTPKTKCAQILTKKQYNLRLFNKLKWVNQMWIEHIGTIGMVAMVILVAAHFGLHFFFKYQKKKKDEAKSQELEKANKD
ncbi:MAG: hypothetical protein JXK16_13175 [Thiotrichales bacterium]|nr:hypothetical protein [Thiotrichales bacterium]